MTSKPYLMTHVLPEELAAVATLCGENATIVPNMAEPFPAVGIDRKADHVYAHAIHRQAIYLVSGDDYLPRVGQIDGVRIISPAAFQAILAQAGLVPDW